MCGITGWVDYGRDLSVETTVLRTMTDTMSCRGPDERAGLRALLAQPDAPVFELVDPVEVTSWLASDVSLPPSWSIPGPLAWAAYLLMISDWLVGYRVRLR